MPVYPYTIENGAGEKMTWLGVTRGPDGDRLTGEMVAQPGAGPPMHVHYLQEEAMQVVSGRLGYEVLGEEPKFAGAGELAVFAPGVPHRWWNAGDGELRATGWAKPPDNMEFFLTAVFASAKAANRGGRPQLFDAAFLMTRYRREFAMLALPAPVRRFVLPVAYALGRLLGKYEKYKDAPEPITSRAGRTRT